MTATLPVTAETRPQATIGQAGAGQAASHPAGVGGGNDARAPGCGPRPGPSLVERGYVPGHFGGVPVFVGPELAAQIKAIRQQPS
jgi:hypothetical protein